MEGKTKFGDIRKDLIKNKETSENYKESERNWSQYDSDLFTIGSTFYDALPDKYVSKLNNKIYAENEEFGMAFKEYIENELSFGKKRTAIEFGGPGSNLFDGFTKGFFKKTVGVCLDDVRQNYIKNFDNNSGHSVISGDIVDVNNRKLFEEINNKLDTNKVDLIISRMQGPLNDLEKNPAILDRIIRKWYHLLNKDGILFAQFEYLDQHNPIIQTKYLAEINPPPVTKAEKYVRQWAEVLKKNFPEIEIQLGRGVIRLVKKDGSPEELISSKDLFNQELNLVN